MRKPLQATLICGILLSVLGGCSSRAVYNDLQRNFQAQCYEKYVGNALDECLARYDTDYDVYKKQSQEVLKEKDVPSLTEFEKQKAQETKKTGQKPDY